MESLWEEETFSLFSPVASQQEVIKSTIINTSSHNEIILLFHSTKELEFNGMVQFSVPRRQFYFGATKASQTLILFGGGTPTTARAALTALDLFCRENGRSEQYENFRPFLMKIWSCCTKKFGYAATSDIRG